MNKIFKDVKLMPKSTDSGLNEIEIVYLKRHEN